MMGSLLLLLFFLFFSCSSFYVRHHIKYIVNYRKSVWLQVPDGIAWRKQHARVSFTFYFTMCSACARVDVSNSACVVFVTHQLMWKI